MASSPVAGRGMGLKCFERGHGRGGSRLEAAIASVRMLEETLPTMHVEPTSCHGHWRLWLTEIPNHRVHREELTLLPSGEARWCVTYGYSQESNPPLQWRFDDEGCLLLVTENESILSRCAVELTGDLMTLTPAHGFRSLFERVTGSVAAQEAIEAF